MRNILIFMALLASACSDPIAAQTPIAPTPIVIEATEPDVEKAPEAPPEPVEETSPQVTVVEAEAPSTIPASEAIPRYQSLRTSRPGDDSLGELPEVDPVLLAAIRRELSINLPNGTTAPVRHCRSAGPSMGGSDRWQRCQRRITLFTRYFQAAGTKHGVDPWILAAMARRESGFSPTAQGSVGEYGIMQLHPRGIGYRSPYVMNPRYRQQCQNQPGACQEGVVNLGAELIGRALQRCGSIEAALGAYNRGRCGETTYTTRVMRQLARMRAPVVNQPAQLAVAR